MKYVIRIKSGLNQYGTRVTDEYSTLSTLTEFVGSQSTPIVFESIGDAEVYAQDHELPNYTIQPLTEEKEGAQLLNG